MCCVSLPHPPTRVGHSHLLQLSQSPHLSTHIHSVIKMDIHFNETNLREFVLHMNCMLVF